MKNNKRLYGGILGTIGFLLSPLSWWNDLFVNFPLAYLAASIASIADKALFLKAFIVSYWLTNLLGFVLMQEGINNILKKDGKPGRYSWKYFLRDILLSLAYTALIVMLVKTGFIKPISGYFNN